ncbi:ABC transporter substrate-binding protein [Actinocorallia sp. A-T 12471]|uniref:ABC transporter substrate-binding protein n=1 Tax=Actinocorallia sp. A-T 12471 TaxID=3089813 RepID=UPI0029CF06F2|nr:ABC transporter substrate-binding protein [Actinocorallia sp. A-T 12471]MDX6739651.1 ABC transporter substrate-binding protein [Actinocorallia sp. A-T 12471]
MPRNTRPRLVLTASAAALSLLLSACGGDADPEVSAEDNAAAGKELATILGIDASAKNGDGLTWKIGAALPMSGIGSADGVETSNAVKLAVRHIEAAGGPKIDVTFVDHGSGDPAKSKQAINELVAAKVPAKLSSYVDGFGAMLEETSKNKILTFDGVGGTAMYAQGVPYFYGTRAVSPNDSYPGAFEWFKRANPGKSDLTVGLVGWDVGGPASKAIKDDVLAKIEQSGLKFSGLYELLPAGSTDFSAVLPKVASANPDLLLLGLAGQAPGAFMAQAKAAGVKSQELGMEFTTTAVAASKGVFDAEGFAFAMDYFDAGKAENPLATFFVKEYEAAYGEKPGFYAANMYEDALALWELVRHVLAEGGDVNDGAQLLAALEKDHEFPSVYGGDAATPGVLALDPKTHSVSTRPQGVFEYKDGEISPLATFDMNGAGFAQP